MSDQSVKRWKPSQCAVFASGDMEFIEASDFDRIVAELRAEVKRFYDVDHEDYLAPLEHALQVENKKLRQSNARLRSILEAVRSQMCWERDRDQLSMGMSDLHDDVTKVLGKDET